jgi:hypothetical protein
MYVYIVYDMVGFDTNHYHSVTLISRLLSLSLFITSTNHLPNRHPEINHPLKKTMTEKEEKVEIKEHDNIGRDQEQYRIISQSIVNQSQALVIDRLS